MMNRKIPDRPHPTPNPDKPHTAAGSDRSSHVGAVPGAHPIPGEVSSSVDELVTQELTPDSSFDDVDAVLSQSLEQPDPDPNLESSAVRPAPRGAADPTAVPLPAQKGLVPRTSEIFRSVVMPGGATAGSSGSADRTGPQEASPVESATPAIGVLDRRPQAGDSRDEAEPQHEGRIPWGHVLLLSYSSVLTLALIWIIGSGRIPKAGAPAPAAEEKAAVESPSQAAEPAEDPSPPPLPPENLATIGQTVRLQDLEVTPLAVEAVPLELIRAIDPGRRRRERDCLVLRLRLVNRSNNQAFAPVDLNLVRDRDLKAFDPFIATSDGRSIPLFPLAVDSEWSIAGQRFPVLRPGDSAQTFVAAEAGSAGRLADEMTWRVRLRTGVYRIDMLGVKFAKGQVRRPPARVPEKPVNRPLAGKKAP
jgi:hypothetical protein